MRRASQLNFFASAVAMLASLSGCAGAVQNAAGVPGSLTARSAAQRPVLAAAPKSVPVMLGIQSQQFRAPALVFDDPGPTFAAGVKTGLYVSEYNPSEVNLYALPDSKNAAPACVLGTQYVNGIGVNSAGTVYVPQGAINKVTTYVKGTCSTTGLTLSEPYGQPGDVAFASNGTTYVLDIIDNAGTAGLISVYKKNATHPSSTLTDTSIAEALGVAVDASNDVFVSYLTPNETNALIVFKSGKMPGKILHISGNSLIVGLEVDANQNLIGVDNGSSAVLTYAPPYTGKPSRTFSTVGASLEGKLDSANKNLYVGDIANGTVDVYRYPSGTYVYSISNGLQKASHVIGVAVDPAAPN